MGVEQLFLLSYTRRTWTIASLAVLAPAPDLRASTYHPEGFSFSGYNSFGPTCRSAAPKDWIATVFLWVVFQCPLFLCFLYPAFLMFAAEHWGEQLCIREKPRIILPIQGCVASPSHMKAGNSEAKSLSRFLTRELPLSDNWSGTKL